MKKIQHLFLLMLTLSISSCFIADDLLVEKKAPILSLKQKTQTAISKYIKSKSGNEKYYKFGFSDLIIHKPKQLIELDKLKAIDNKRPSAELKTKIEKLEKKIKKNKIKYTIEMDHVFSLEPLKGTKTNLFETKFFLSDSLTVIDIKPITINQLTDDELYTFVDYFHESPIFTQGEYYQNKALSKEFYSFLKTHQQKLATTNQKSEFLQHSIWLCNQIKKTGQFNQTTILKTLVNKKMRADTTINMYAELKFSDLFEIKEDENLKGYYFFHKFSHSINGTDIVSTIYVGFTPYYEIKEILEVPKPYKQYFDE